MGRWRKWCSAYGAECESATNFKKLPCLVKAKPFLVVSVSAHFVMTPCHVKYFFCFCTNCYGPVSSSGKTDRDTFQRHLPWCLVQWGHPQLPLVFKPGKRAACGLVFTQSFFHGCPTRGCSGGGAEGDQQGMYSSCCFPWASPYDEWRKRCISRRWLRCSVVSLH